MKRLLLLAVLALALPMAAWADSNIDVSNAKGTFAASASGSARTNSTLFKVGSAVGSNLGSFSNMTWTTLGNHNLVLAETISGTLVNGVHIDGATSQLAFKGSGLEFLSGDTSLAVPEPGTLGLLGTGLVGIAGLLRRKYSRA